MLPRIVLGQVGEARVCRIQKNKGQRLPRHRGQLCVHASIPQVTLSIALDRLDRFAACFPSYGFPDIGTERLFGMVLGKTNAQSCIRARLLKMHWIVVSKPRRLLIHRAQEGVMRSLEATKLRD